MADNTLEPGQVRTGQLIDGVQGTPHQSCTLTYEPRYGAVLAIPFVVGTTQFEHTMRWFRNQDPPNSLIFWDNIGPVTLSKLRWRGNSGAPYVLGRLDAEVVIFGEPSKQAPEYKFKTLISSIDGLEEFANFLTLDSEFQQTNSGQKVVVTVEAKDEVQWRSGGFSYSIRANAAWTSTVGNDFTARSEALLQTATSRGALAKDHLIAQWPIRALLIMANSKKLYWRKHWVVDQKFSSPGLPGQPALQVPYRAILRTTIPDTEQPKRTRLDFATPMFRLEHLNASRLKKWCELYRDELFQRALEPAVEVINGASQFVEPQLMMIALGLEAMGYYRDPARKKGTPLSAQIQRCIMAAQADWPEIGTAEGIAKAIANTNNDLKHPDRLKRPDILQLALITRLAVVIMRLQLFDLLNFPDNLRTNFLASNDVRQVIAEFKLNRITIDPDGRIVR